MDIADAFFNENSLAWLSHLGVQPANARKGTDWLTSFGGGLLATCGLDHIGGPESDEYGDRGLHGSIGSVPAEIESIVQPDPKNGELDMRIVGRMKETQALGQQYELKRTISGTLGQPVIRIHDEVTNVGNSPAPHMLLYHFNFGWPLVDRGANILWEGSWKPREKAGAAKIFKMGNDFRKCPDPMDDHRAGGEEAVFIDIEADASGQCVCGIANPNLGIAALLRFEKNQLPWLTNWQHWGPGEYVTGLEPGTNVPKGQAAARKDNTLIFLNPGEKRMYHLELEVLTDLHEMETLINKN